MTEKEIMKKKKQGLISSDEAIFLLTLVSYKKDFCRYAVWDEATGVMLACGEKHKVCYGLEYVESFRCLQSRFRKIRAYRRKTVVKGREVYIVYWYNTPLRAPFRTVCDGGLILGLR